MQGPFAINEAELREKLRQPYVEQADYACAMTDRMVAEAFRSCARGKTCGLDMRTSEIWTAALEAEPRIAMATAWAGAEQTTGK